MFSLREYFLVGGREYQNNVPTPQHANTQKQTKLKNRSDRQMNFACPFSIFKAANTLHSIYTSYRDESSAVRTFYCCGGKNGMSTAAARELQASRTTRGGQNRVCRISYFTNRLHGSIAAPTPGGFVLSLRCVHCCSVPTYIISKFNSR